MFYSATALLVRSWVAVGASAWCLSASWTQVVLLSLLCLLCVWGGVLGLLCCASFAWPKWYPCFFAHCRRPMLTLLALSLLPTASGGRVVSFSLGVGGVGGWVGLSLALSLEASSRVHLTVLAVPVHRFSHRPISSLLPLALPLSRWVSLFALGCWLCVLVWLVFARFPARFFVFSPSGAASSLARHFI